MNIVVCIKQVPGTNKVEIDEKTGVLKRDGVESKLNPYDLFALECAVRLKQQYGGTVTAVTMGPPQCESAIREAFMMGADAGVILSDRRFGGADVLATSYTIAQGIRKIGGFDLVICGKQTTDGDTAQVGAELAEFLGLPHITNICRIVEMRDGAMILEGDMPGSIVTVSVRMPCLIAVDKDICQPRLPSYKLKKATAKREIRWLKLDDLDDRDPLHYGLNGSPTQVKRIFPPDHSRSQVVLKGGAELGDRLFEDLRGKKFLQEF